jgi:hypothetical protein
MPFRTTIVDAQLSTSWLAGQNTRPTRGAARRNATYCWLSAKLAGGELMVSPSGAGFPQTAILPRVSVAQLLAEKNARSIRSLEELAADTFDSDHELEEFLASTYAERRRDLT